MIVLTCKAKKASAPSKAKTVKSKAAPSRKQDQSEETGCDPLEVAHQQNSRPTRSKKQPEPRKKKMVKAVSENPQSSDSEQVLSDIANDTFKYDETVSKTIANRAAKHQAALPNRYTADHESSDEVVVIKSPLVPKENPKSPARRFYEFRVEERPGAVDHGRAPFQSPRFGVRAASPKTSHFFPDEHKLSLKRSHGEDTSGSDKAQPVPCKVKYLLTHSVDPRMMKPAMASIQKSSVRTLKRTGTESSLDDAMADAHRRKKSRLTLCKSPMDAVDRLTR